MAKARVGVRLKDAVGGKAKSHYQSEDLKSLTERYNVFVKKLKKLIAFLKAHNDIQDEVLRRRLAVANHLAEMAQQSPLAQLVGVPAPVADPKDKDSNNQGQLPPQPDPYAGAAQGDGQSYMAIHASAERKGALYASKYKQHVIDYVIEWEKVITTRVSNGLKKWEQVRVETDHYHKKVEGLRQAANTAMSKGKQVDPKSADKLTRNEEKWIQARQSHQKVTTELCILIDEIVNRSWRDLHPVIIKLTQFDMTTADDSNRTMQQLTAVVAKLKNLAAAEGIKPQARLSDLQAMDPAHLSTRPEGVPKPGALAIEPAMGGMSLDNAGLGDPFSPASAGSMSSPEAPGGPGGYPVPMPVQRNTSNFSRSSSMGSFSSTGNMYPPPQAAAPAMDMLAMQNHSAPAPTMDQIQGAGMMVPMTGPPTSSGYNQYTMSPQPPQHTGNRSRHSSLDGSLHSEFSSGLAPPPMGAPPPPPMQQVDPFGSGYGAPAPASTNPFGAPPSPAPAGGMSTLGGSMGSLNGMYNPAPANNNVGGPNQFYGGNPSPGQPPLPPTYQRRSSNPFDM